MSILPNGSNDKTWCDEHGFYRATCVEAGLHPDQPRSQEAAPVTDEDVARLFHEAYERLAPHYSYKTRPESAVPWADVPRQNKALMLAVAGEVRAALAPTLSEQPRSQEAALPCPYCQNIDGHSFDCPRPRSQEAAHCYGCIGYRDHGDGDQTVCDGLTMTEQHVTLIDGSATLPVTDSTEQPRSQEAALDVERLARALFVTHPLMYPESWPDDDPDDIGPDPQEDAENIAREYSGFSMSTREIARRRTPMTEQPRSQEAALRCLTCGATIFDPLAGACGECGAQDSYVGTQWLKVPPEMRPLDTPPEQPRSQEAALFDAVRRVIRDGIDSPGTLNELHRAFYAVRDAAEQPRSQEAEG